MGQLTAKTVDTQFEAEVLRADPAIKRFKVIKEILWKRGVRPKFHARECICICCIETAIKKSIK